MTTAQTTDSKPDPRVPGVLATLEVIRPAIQSDGGDISFKGIDDEGKVHVELQGACVGCAASTMTISAGVERILMDRVPDITGVINDTEFTHDHE